MKSKLFTKKMFIPVILILALLMGTCVVAQETVVKVSLQEQTYQKTYKSEYYPDGLYYIGFKPHENGNKVAFINAFYGNYYHLAVSKIPCYYENITITGISENSYVDCIGLEKVILPQTIEYIEKDAFLDCRDIKEMYIPASVKNINKTAFNGTSNFKMYVEKNSTAERFAKNNNIDYDYYTPDPVKKDTSDYSKMKIEEMIDNNIFNIYYYENNACCAFVQFNAMSEETNFKVPEKIKGTPVTNIVAEAFSWCNNIKNITLPKTVKTIGNYAFVECRNLKKVYFTENVTSIGKDIFQKSKKAIICAPKNSYAHKYAIENKIPFEETK